MECMNQEAQAGQICLTKIKYFANTTNLRNHISRFHPEQTSAMVKITANQPRTEEALSTLPPLREVYVLRRVTQMLADCLYLLMEKVCMNEIMCSNIEN